jgi:peptidoglycan biosynthesis protein MviN/MurJ (putative lipid II flippase)
VVKQNSTGDERTARNVAVLSLGHASVMALGGVLALLIAHFFGRSARTDAFFAAYGLYSVALVFSQAFRLTALPRLVEDRDDLVSNRLLAGVAVVIVLAAVPMVLLAGSFAELLADGDPTGEATDSLRALWPALGGQLLIGLLAALLLVRGRFGVIGLGYVASGLTSIAVFLALEGALALQAVSVALGVSSISLAVLFFVALARAGWRLRPQAYRRVGEATVEAGRLMVASASFAAANIGYVICVAVASRAGEGEATLYAYAYFSAALLVATTAVSAAMVRAPQILAGAEAAGEAARSTVSTYRFTVILIAPVLALALVVGRPVLGFLLGADFEGEDAQRLVITLVCLVGWVLGSAAGLYAVVHLLANGRAPALAAIAVAQTVLLVGLAIAGNELAGIEGIAIGQSLSLLLGTVAQLRLAFPREWNEVLLELGGATARGAAMIAVAAGPGLLLYEAAGPGTGETLIAAVVCCALVLGAALAAFPRELRAMGSMLRRDAAAC